MSDDPATPKYLKDWAARQLKAEQLKIERLKKLEEMKRQLLEGVGMQSSYFVPHIDFGTPVPTGDPGDPGDPAPLDPSDPFNLSDLLKESPAVEEIRRRFSEGLVPPNHDQDEVANSILDIGPQPLPPIEQPKSVDFSDPQSIDAVLNFYFPGSGVSHYRKQVHELLGTPPKEKAVIEEPVDSEQLLADVQRLFKKREARTGLHK